MTNRKRLAVLAVISIAPLMLTTSAVGGGPSHPATTSAPALSAQAPVESPMAGLKSVRERIDPAMLFATLGMAGMLVGRRASLRQ